MCQLNDDNKGGRIKVVEMIIFQQLCIINSNEIIRFKNWRFDILLINIHLATYTISYMYILKYKDYDSCQELLCYYIFQHM